MDKNDQEEMFIQVTQFQAIKDFKGDSQHIELHLEAHQPPLQFTK